MKKTTPLKQYFIYTKKERTGIFTLLIVILLIAISPIFFSFFIKEKKYDFNQFQNEIAQLRIKQKDSNRAYTAYRNFDENNYQNFHQPSYQNNYYKNQPTGELFYFDPNTATAADWQRLGVRDKTIATIQNYLSKGGHFYKAEDIVKIWGLHEDLVERLIPYVQIASVASNNYPQNNNYEKPVYEKKTYAPTLIDVNNADTAALIALPGIGSKLAQRIITFREKLGGFSSVQQIGETYGLPDSTFQKIKARLTLGETALKQYNINTATIDELKQHPYIKYNIANAIVQYRNQHGTFASITDIKKIMIIDDVLYNKLLPYLKIN